VPLDRRDDGRVDVKPGTVIGGHGARRTGGSSTAFSESGSEEDSHRGSLSPN